VLPRLTALLLIALPLFADWPPPRPDALILTVRETAGVARAGEIVRSGVPLPRALNVQGTAGLAVVDTQGQFVPVQFRILARWHAGLSVATAPIQWLLVTFPATVPANGTATYRVTFDGVNPAPAVPLTVAQNGNQFTIDTGAARFVVGGGAGALFDEIRLANDTRLLSGSAMTAQANGNGYAHDATRRVVLEESGPLSAVVVVEGSYAMPAVGGGGLGSRRRYVFSAGSPVAMVRHSVAWEGDRCGAGNLSCNGSPNAVRMQQVRDALSLDVAYPATATAVGAFSATTTGTVNAGQTAAVRQLLRNVRTDPLAATVTVPGAATVNAQQADGGMLAVSGAAGAVAIALDHMHRYEPQALRILADGRLAIDLVDSNAWLGARQGLFATLAVGVFPPSPPRATLDRQVWAPLNAPLHAWPQAEWFAASEAVDEFPVGTPAADFAGFDAEIEDVAATTLQQIDERGLAGLMTFGLYPRNWANPLYSDEIDCGGSDAVTPAESWDDPYWCGTWTDYHNTVMTIPSFVMRNGRTEWLDELATPGALRSLHTQIFQCAPGDGYFYCGQAPAGYGGYRADFNSSHAYFENLMLYYWLTGDSTVVETLQRGAAPMRNYLCSRRPASPCLPTDAPEDDYANVTGRVFVQWHSVFRFLGLASSDATYLEDYAANIARQYTLNYAEVLQNGVRYGFLIDGSLQQVIDGPGTYSTDQLWMASLYDQNLLYRLQRDTNDAPIGSPALLPSGIIESWARTLDRFGSTVAGDGTAAGTWPNALFFTFTGSRIGGALTSVTPNQGGGDPNLYDTGKAVMTATIARAADSSGEPSLAELELDLARFAWDAALADPTPLSKQEGELMIRLPSAIARLSLVNVPTGVTATAVTSTTVNVTWNAVEGATSYRVHRRAAGGGFTLVGTPAVPSFNDTVAANAAYLYRVRAVDGSGESPDSAPDVVTTVIFTIDPVVRAAHVTQLRTAVNAVQALAGQPATAFTNSTVIRRVHLVELRNALDAARAALALPALVHPDPVITERVTPVRAGHFATLRDGVR
jgi:hypothetical protein